MTPELSLKDPQTTHVPSISSTSNRTYGGVQEVADFTAGTQSNTRLLPHPSEEEKQKVEIVSNRQANEVGAALDSLISLI